MNYAQPLPVLASANYYVVEWAAFDASNTLVKGVFYFSFGDNATPTAPRSLRLIRAEVSARVGAPVMLDGQEIGIYTSVCQEFALALIKRSKDSSSIQIGS